MSRFATEPSVFSFQFCIQADHGELGDGKWIEIR